MMDAIGGRPHERDAAIDARLGLIAGGVIASYRASLLERDLWEHVRAGFARRAAQGAEWLDDVAHGDWVELEAYVTLLDVVGETMGLDALRSLVRKRAGEPAGCNFYAPILRSWARSFGTSPEHLLRGVVHVWRAALRQAGSIRPLAVRAGEVHLLIEGPLARAYRTSPALAAELEGLALSLLDSAHPRPVFVEVELRRDRQPVALVCSYRN